MKIVFLSFYSGIVNRGVETFVDAISSKLAEKHQVTVFQSGQSFSKSKYSIIQKTIVFPKQWKDDSLSPKHPIKRLFLNDRKRAELKFTLACFGEIIKLKPDIIFPMNSGWQAFICRILSFFIHSKFVVAGQSGPGWDDRWLLLLKPDVFIALSQSQGHWFKKNDLWGTINVQVIPNGVDLNMFNPQTSAAKVKLKKPIIITVAASIPSKRLEDTIKAISKIGKASLLLIGSGYQDKLIDLFASKTLGKNQFQHLYVNHPDIPSLYTAADIFTLCSDSSEAFGIVYLEAMASNLPCVATNDNLRQEIIGPAGVFVDNPKDHDEYSKKLIKALKTNWGQKPRLQAEKFSWKEVAKAYEKVFKEILATKI